MEVQDPAKDKFEINADAQKTNSGESTPIATTQMPSYKTGNPDVKSLFEHMYSAVIFFEMIKAICQVHIGEGLFRIELYAVLKGHASCLVVVLPHFSITKTEPKDILIGI